MICKEIYPLFAALWLSHIARKALTPGRVSGPPRERQPQERDGTEKEAAAEVVEVVEEQESKRE